MISSLLNHVTAFPFQATVLLLFPVLNFSTTSTSKLPPSLILCSIFSWKILSLAFIILSGSVSSLGETCLSLWVRLFCLTPHRLSFSSLCYGAPLSGTLEPASTSTGVTFPRKAGLQMLLYKRLLVLLFNLTFLEDIRYLYMQAWITF